MSTLPKPVSALRRKILAASAAAGALAASGAGFAQAQGYPNKRVRILVGFAPGGIVTKETTLKFVLEPQ